MISINEGMAMYAFGLVVGIAAGIAFGWAWFSPTAKRKPTEQLRCLP